MQGDSNSYRIQQKLSIAIFSAGFIVSIVNFISIYSHSNFSTAITDQSVMVLLIISLIILSSYFMDYEIVRFLQVLIVIITAVLAILDVYNSIHGLGLLIIAAFISFKYGYFKRWLKTKALISIMLTSVVMELSAIRQNPEGKIMYGLDAVIYIVLFFFVTYLIYSDEIKYYIENNKAKEDTIETLTGERDLLLNRVKSLDKRIALMSPDFQPIDLNQYKITAAERRVIEILVLYRATDKEIADRLCISYHTVKNHFRSIRNKLGVDRREEIIDLCRFNFLE